MLKDPEDFTRRELWVYTSICFLLLLGLLIFVGCKHYG